MGWLLRLGEFFVPVGLIYGFSLLIVHSILCGDHAIKQIDKPFISATDKVDDWSL